MDMLLGALIWAAIWGALGAAVGNWKNRPDNDAIWLAVLLGPIGIIIALCMKPGLPPGQARVVQCPRCKVQQAVPNDARVGQCEGCKKQILDEQPAAKPVAKKRVPNAAEVEAAELEALELAAKAARLKANRLKAAAA
jgi:Zn-finger nucleic acid-binding protein